MKLARCSTLAVIIMLVSMLAAATGTAADSPKPVIIKFPAFSLSPGEKIAGITVKTSEGHLMTGCMPGRWRCDYRGSLIHCFSLHPQYAVGMTGLLPEIIVRDLMSGKSNLSIEASVEYLDDNGKEYSKEFNSSDLIIK